MDSKEKIQLDDIRVVKEMHLKLTGRRSLLVRRSTSTSTRRRDSTTDDGRDVGGPTANMRVFAHERAESRARRGDLGENARDR